MKSKIYTKAAKAKRLLTVVMAASAIFTAKAQDKVEANIGAGFVNQYIWRGLDVGDASLQPTVGVAYKGISLSAWGSVGLTDATDTKELDLTLAYSIAGFNFGITDYWFSQGSYFKYKNKNTTHVWEANVGYDFGFLSLQWFTNFAGDDGVNGSGDRAFSSYFELAAPFRLGGLEWKATLGVVPFTTSFYSADGFAVTNVGLCATKEFVIKDKYHLPVFVGLTANPNSEKMYLIFGTSFSM
ncbi:MAG: hypothetical protein K6F94_04390 [Bacteroidaceae bacterium]|nr:hypothetical protein [Bacteroidaceae bacterium]